VNNKNIKSYFLKNHIPYNDIDENMRELVYCFNKIGLTTEFCCEGHTNGACPEIIFEDSIKESDIDKHLNILLNGTYTGEFYQWIRASDPCNTNSSKNNIFKNYIFKIASVKYNYSEKCNAIQNVINTIYQLYNID
jgi:hypothetical protein